MATVETEVKGSSLIVRLKNTGCRNAISLAMWRDVGSIFVDANENASIKTIILTGAGKDFSTGADIKEFKTLRSDASQSQAYESTIETTCAAIESSTKTTLAVLQGYCLAGACHLALACDLRMADDTLKLGISASRMGIVYSPYSIGRLVALIGPAHAKRLLLGGETIGAPYASHIGLVDHVSGDLWHSVHTLADDIGKGAPLALGGMKWIVGKFSEGWSAAHAAAAQRLIDVAAGSADYAEARAAFMEKRLPRFYGK